MVGRAEPVGQGLVKVRQHLASNAPGDRREMVGQAHKLPRQPSPEPSLGNQPEHEIAFSQLKIGVKRGTVRG
eukprot:15452831-Alexandrium_andersonii.AAC.1